MPQAMTQALTPLYNRWVLAGKAPSPKYPPYNRKVFTKIKLILKHPYLFITGRSQSVPLYNRKVYINDQALTHAPVPLITGRSWQEKCPAPS